MVIFSTSSLFQTSTIKFIIEGCRKVRWRRAGGDNIHNDLEGAISGILRQEIHNITIISFASVAYL